VIKQFLETACYNNQNIRKPVVIFLPGIKITWWRVFIVKAGVFFFAIHHTSP
jgi:hypothetical protein